MAADSPVQAGGWWLVGRPFHFKFFFFFCPARPIVCTRGLHRLASFPNLKKPFPDIPDIDVCVCRRRHDYRIVHIQAGPHLERLCPSNNFKYTYIQIYREHVCIITLERRWALWKRAIVLAGSAFF
jgi:hypothetical protein